MEGGRLKAWALVAVLLLGACQLALPGAKPAADAPAGGLAGPAVTVSALPAAPEQDPTPAKTTLAATVDTQPAADPVAAPTPTANPTATAKPAPEKPAEAEPATAAAEAPEAGGPPKPPLSAEGQACEKRGGLWSATGKSGVMACVKRTRDFGKSCSRDRDCEGACLARSRSCAPITPLFGCHDVLQDDGRKVTLCLD